MKTFAVTTLVSFAATMATAQTTCLPRDALVSTLDSKYAETLKGRGLHDETALFEFFSSQDGSSWTMVRTFPNGMSCIMAAGQHWIEQDPVPPGVPG